MDTKCCQEERMTERDKNFIELYFEAVDENIDEVIRDLKNSGIDPEESEQRIMQMIREQRAELKIERGKNLKARVIGLIKKRDEFEIDPKEERHLAIAARKLNALDKEDIETIKKDSLLLKDIGKLIDSDTDDTGKTS